MRFHSFILFLLMLFSFACGSNNEKKEKPLNKKAENTTEKKDDGIKIAGTKQYAQFVNELAIEYKKVNPEIKIEVFFENNEQKTMDLLKSGKIDLVVSATSVADSLYENTWNISIAKDFVMFIISKKHPDLQQILNNGVTIAQLKSIFTNPEISWSTYTNGDCKDNPIVYIYGDGNTYMKCLGFGFQKKFDEFSGKHVDTYRNMLDLVKNNKTSIGIVPFNAAFDELTGVPVKGIEIIPIDQNANGTIDDREFFYYKKDVFTHAASKLNYPKVFAMNISIISDKKPVDEHALLFLEWVLTTGRNYIPQKGYINLEDQVQKAAIENISDKK